MVEKEESLEFMGLNLCPENSKRRGERMWGYGVDYFLKK